MGDMPIYVGRDSVDVWANQGLFELDSLGEPRRVAGVPPDAYSETGQLWGNPLFDWEAMQADGYRWWIDRVARTLHHCDALRIDHFIGFARYWAVDAKATEATGGSWIVGPGRAVFDAIEEELGRLPLIAEDLGSVDASTVELRDSLGLPGMRVIQFGLDEDPGNPHRLEKHPVLSVVYTGTHDGPTARGWWESQDDWNRGRLGLGNESSPASASMIRLALKSEAFWAVVPLQDLLDLGDEARMNRPGTLGGNWIWRASDDALQAEVAALWRKEVVQSSRMLAQR